ncbi:MAG: 5-formyltetrahydrofolate cyclo-ligase, partial [Bacteroidota bacterium]|nr:5-formyltetrahydrofolate cyclo-ligase [Bacteroidota bacterium]
ELIVPVVDFHNKTLLHKYYNNNSLLDKNVLGIMEPTNSELFYDLDRIDMILMPLLSFDKKGNRVGYGYGYYDKFVSTDQTIEDVNQIACEKGFLDVGDMLVSLAAMPIKEKGMVNTLRVTEIESCNF